MWQFLLDTERFVPSQGHTGFHMAPKVTSEGKDTAGRVDPNPTPPHVCACSGQFLSALQPEVLSHHALLPHHEGCAWWGPSHPQTLMEPCALKEDGDQRGA